MTKKINLIVWVALALSIAAWLIVGGGYLYAELFVEDVRQTKLSIMTPQTFAKTTFAYVGWIVSGGALTLSIVALFLCDKTKKLWASLGLSALYVCMPLILTIIA